MSEANMHALLITFKTRHADAVAPKTSGLPQTIARPEGLVSKTWFSAAAVRGAFLLFADRPSAERYLRGPVMTRLTEDPTVTELDIRHLDVRDEPSMLTEMTDTQPHTIQTIM